MGRRGWRHRLVDDRCSLGSAHLPLDVTRIVPVEKVTQQAAIEVGRSKQPVHDGKCKVHVSLHHARLIMVGRVMTPDRIYQREVSDKSVVVDMAAEMHEFIDEVHRRRRQNEQPSAIRGNNLAKKKCTRQRQSP